MIEIPALEYHAAHGCSLTCDQCSHYSNMRLRGAMPTPNDAATEFAKWSTRIAPKRFAILGGEPALNPGLVEIIRVASAYWPDANKMLVSNGLQLHRHPKLPALLQHYGWRLDVSQHGNDPAYMEKFREVEDMLTLWVAMYGDLHIRVRNSRPNWRRQYKIEDGRPKPYNSRPKAAYKICLQRTCHQLYQGKLWKCPAVAYFGQLVDKIPGTADDPAWAPFAGYQAIEPDASDDELRAFAAEREIEACRCCPANVIKFRHADPTIPAPAR